MYANYDQFWLWGVEDLEPDVAHADQDCAICLEPLVMNPPEDLGLSEGIEYHYAVRILACSHVHANDCLMEWLQVGNTCPTCNLVLFSPHEEQPLDAEDIEDIFSDLAIRFGVDRAYTSMFPLVSPDERRVMAARLDEERELEEERDIYDDSDMRSNSEDEQYYGQYPGYYEDDGEDETPELEDEGDESGDMDDAVDYGNDEDDSDSDDISEEGI